MKMHRAVAIDRLVCGEMVFVPRDKTCVPLQMYCTLDICRLLHVKWNTTMRYHMKTFDCEPSSCMIMRYIFWLQSSWVPIPSLYTAMCYHFLATWFEGMYSISNLKSEKKYMCEGVYMYICCTYVCMYIWMYVYVAIFICMQILVTDIFFTQLSIGMYLCVIL